MKFVITFTGGDKLTIEHPYKTIAEFTAHIHKQMNSWSGCWLFDEENNISYPLSTLTKIEMVKEKKKKDADSK